MSADHVRTPGQLITTLLNEKGWSRRVLAIVLGLDEAVITRLTADKRPVDGQMALALGDVFGVDPERFMELQSTYSLALARLVAQPDPRRAIRAQIFGTLPIAEMIKRGWLDADDIRNLPRVEAALSKFFGVESVEEIEVLPHAAKKTHAASPATPAQSAWMYRVRHIAADMMVNRYSPSAVRAAVPRLQDLLWAPEEARKAPRILVEAGIRFVIVESLTSTKIDGVTLWLNDFSPVIGMSLRYDRMDNFWFVLRHEIEHVLCGHGRVAAILDTELEGARAGVGEELPEEERTANEAAANFCVPRKSLERFIARKAPFFAERDILGFAKTIKIHPGLIAGQLQHHIKRYDRFKDHQTKIRSLVTPSAMVDGWGDVAPVDL